MPAAKPTTAAKPQSPPAHSPRRRGSASAFVLIMLLATGPARGSSPNPLPSSLVGGEAILDAPEARAVAAEAYVWGWP